MRRWLLAIGIAVLGATAALAGTACPPGGCGRCSDPTTCHPPAPGKPHAGAAPDGVRALRAADSAAPAARTADAGRLPVADTAAAAPSPAAIPFRPLLPPTDTMLVLSQQYGARIDAAPDSQFLKQPPAASPAIAGRWYARHGELARGIFDTRALQYFIRATELDSSAAAAWLGRGQAEAALGDGMAAETSYRRGIAAQPAQAELRYALALLLGERGAAAAAAEQLRAVTLLDAHHAAAWFNLGVALTQLGDFAGAADAYEQVLRLRANDVPTLYNLAITCRKSERSEQAHECYQQLLLLDAALAAKLYPLIY
ncbi:MAG TPA: tetratricopeptide repeat protein [bacterium]|nr:tetratricopeptide repeat protein [bacterium]